MHRNRLDLADLLAVELEAKAVHEIATAVRDHRLRHRAADLGIQRAALELDGAAVFHSPCPIWTNVPLSVYFAVAAIGAMVGSCAARAV